MFRFIPILCLATTITTYSVAQSTHRIDTGSLTAERGGIKGRVTNEKGEPVEYATVLLRQPPDSVLVAGATTDSTGRYEFGGVAKGKYILTATFVGYGGQSTTIELREGDQVYTAPVTVMKEDTRMLNEVVVREQKQLVEQDGGKLILNVQNTIIAAGGSAADILERAPGVNIDQNNQISVNGKPGVGIMIDGKPTYLPPAELATLLRSINANNIASIEVIANPSARFDASGNAGIINIKLKKSALDGFNASATGGGGRGRYGKANGSINLNYRRGKWNHFLIYGYTFNKRFTDVFTDRVTLRNNGDPVFYTQQLDRIQRLPSHTWQAGSEWQWDPKNSITIITSGGSNQRNTANDSYTEIKSTPDEVADSTYTLTNYQRYRWYNVSSSIGYRHKFAGAGSELSADLDYSTYNFNLNDNFDIKEFLQTDIFKKQYNVLSNQPSSFNIYTARMDFTRPFNKETSMETGVKLSYVNTVNEITFVDNKNGQLETDLTRSTDFDYTEKVSAAYVTVKTKLGGFETQLGLRAEQTRYEGFSKRTELSIERDYFKVFPNVSFNRQIGKNYRLGFAYSYRIDRPAYNDLYPSIFYFDPFAAQKGNPALLPQFTHSLQLSQTLAKDIAVNLGYSATLQHIAFVILVNEDRVSEHATKKNFDMFRNYYLTVSAPVRIHRKWSITGNVNVFYNRFGIQLLNQMYDVRKFSGTASITQTVTLPWDLTCEITTVYNAPNVSGLVETRALGSVNAGLQKKMLDGKGSLRLSVTDMFYTNRARIGVAYPGLAAYFYNYPETTVMRLNFTYNIGRAGEVMRRRGGQDEERKRVGVN